MSTASTTPASTGGGNVFGRILTTAENMLAGLSLVAAVLMALGAVLLREFFDVYLFWSEEAIIYLVICSTFFGSVLTLRSDEHVNVDIITIFLGRRGKRVMAIVAALVTTAYVAAVGALAWMLLFEPFSRSVVTPALKLPLWLVELPLALAFTLMFGHSFGKIVRAWRHGAHEVSATDIALAEAEAAGLSADDLHAARRSEMPASAATHHDPFAYLPPRLGEEGERGVDTGSGAHARPAGENPASGEGGDRR